MKLLLFAAFSACLAGGARGNAQQTLVHPASPEVRHSVPTEPGKDARPTAFHDGRFGVRFEVPAGWTFTTRDGQVSSFHLDLQSAPEQAQLRGAASLSFNPYPQSVLSGATFYYSVARHVSPAECAEQAAGVDRPDVQDIAGMEFRHGHDEHGQICTEARDEVYTAFRKGSCYRFDLEVNTFCSVSSGADDLTERQMSALEQQMTDILSSVVLDWKKGASHPVPVPPLVRPQKRPAPELLPRPAATPQVQGS